MKSLLAIKDNKSSNEILNSLTAISDLFFQADITLIDLKWVEGNKQIRDCLKGLTSSLT